MVACRPPDLPALPGGSVRLEKGETRTVQGAGGPLQVTRYDLVGINLDPDAITEPEQFLSCQQSGIDEVISLRDR